MEKLFLGNLGTRRIHYIPCTDGRCKISEIKEENKVLFETLEEGLNYPSAERRIMAECGICIPKYKKTEKEKEKEK